MTRWSGESPAAIRTSYRSRGRNGPTRSAHSMTTDAVVAVEVLGETDPGQLGGRRDPVKIEMVHREAGSVVFVEDREGRAGDVPVRAEGAADAADEAGLPGAEVPEERDDVARLQEPAEPFASGDGLLFRRRVDGEERLRRGESGMVRHPFGVSVATGRIISSIETPPCWKLSRYWLT